MHTRNPIVSSDDRARTVDASAAFARRWLIGAAVAAFLVSAAGPAIASASGATAKPSVGVSPTTVKRATAIAVSGRVQAGATFRLTR